MYIYAVMTTTSPLLIGLRSTTRTTTVSGRRRRIGGLPGEVEK